MPTLINTPSESALDRALASNTISPSHALVFYHRAGKLALTTAHKIKPIKGIPHLEPGRPMTPEDEAKIVAMLLDREADSEAGQAARIRILPPDVLHADAASTTWLLRSQVAPMTLRRNGTEQVVLARWPTLVLHARRRQLYVVALASDDRPGEDTPVFHSPLANVWASGQVCTGSAVLPLGITPSDIDGWNRVMTESAFSHRNHEKTITVVVSPGKGKKAAKVENPDPMDYWAGKDGDHAPFNPDHLTPLNKTLSQWLAELILGDGEDD